MLPPRPPLLSLIWSNSTLRLAVISAAVGVGCLTVSGGAWIALRQQVQPTAAPHVTTAAEQLAGVLSGGTNPTIPTPSPSPTPTPSTSPTVTPKPSSGSTSGSSHTTPTTPSTPSTPSTPVAPSFNRPFATSSLWNRLISSGSYSTNSQINANGHWYINMENYSFPVVYTNASYPLVSIPEPSTWGWPATTLQLRIAPGVTGAGGTDKSLIVIDGTTVYSLYYFQRTDDTHATSTAYAIDNLATGTGFGTLSPFKGAGIRAAGASSLAGLITGTDISAGAINHALAISLAPSQLLHNGFIAPAIAEDYGNSYSGTIPMGARIAIPAGTTMPAGLSSVGQMVWRALRDYGGFVVDQSNGPVLYADPNTVTYAQINPVRDWHVSRGYSDLDLIAPQLQIVH